MKTWAVLSLFATVAFAQSYSSAPTPQPSGNPLIPTNISPGCKAFIDKFDNDQTVASCTKALIQATQNFGPGGSATSSPSTAEITGAIDSICTGPASTACPDSLLRSQLGDFYSACSVELTSNLVDGVLKIYDILYILAPFKGAICSKDDSSNYCLIAGNSANSTGIKGALASGGSTDLTQVQQHLYYTSSGNGLSSRGEDDIVANLTTFKASNLAFIFRQPNMDSGTLCTTCTRNILTSYFNHESDVPYGPGLANSILLGGQDDLVGAIQSKCGANFLSGAVQAAGGIKKGTFGSSTGGAVRGVSNRFAGLVAVAAGALTAAISLL